MDEPSKKDTTASEDLRRAVFLDRDGTLNEDLGYVHQKEDWHWLPGVVETLKRLHTAGYLLVVVSNQSGLAREMYTENDLHSLETWVCEDLVSHGTCIDAWYHCPHLPEITGPCTCRKPQPGLLLQAANDLHIDLANSWMVGDKVSDVQAGLAAGCHCLLLRHSEKVDSTDIPEQVAVVPHLAAAGVHILAPQWRSSSLARLKRGGTHKDCFG
ncbi:MAG: D-glycero-beta-D-manno-heptose 1,7-bisphosphate 7-phosphatase [Desulfovibrio sp.]|nr:D-glycero-beta-D-manno-heptose 1,7-bisphosphate 7-phosphatase [Desulfovibrio sp.]